MYQGVLAQVPLPPHGDVALDADDQNGIIRRMEHVLAERTVEVSVNGQPAGTIHIEIGVPVKVDDAEWKIDVDIHGPGNEPPFQKYFVGVDAWQAIRHAFWIAVVLVETRTSPDARVTYLGDENWSGDVSRDG